MKLIPKYQVRGNPERDKLWRQVYNQRGLSNLPYEQAKNYVMEEVPSWLSRDFVKGHEAYLNSLK